MIQPLHPEVVILNAALELPADQRAAYLDRACVDDAALRRQVEALLHAHERAEDFLESPPAHLDLERTARLTAPLTEKPGDRIGHYKLLQQIGEGGCGVVYMAEQVEPVRRRVALKVIKLGMDTKNVIARFEAERQALALMDHPNIAKVLDAGATETGRPFFVMELVHGIKITEFCDQNNLATRERLDVFVQVCQAIQHAHQKGVIHRDIKPSNILVTLNDGVPMPKVIDFGIAKATQQPLTDKTLFTAFEQFIGTPAYMSPEQAEMNASGIDTRSDIYSLGVLLYELLTGQTPFDSKALLQAGLDGIRQIIREQEPVRPSTRLSTMLAGDLTAAARHRHAEPPRLISLVRGELDWIVMKALEKDRSRRYETANGFAKDVQRYLADEPVVACPPSAGYRLQKIVRRNKLAFAAAGAVVAALLIGLAVSTWLLFKERADRRRALAAENKAQTEAIKSRQVAGFLKQMLQGVGPSRALGRDTAMLREILDKTAESVGTELTNQPEVEVEVRLILAQTYDDLDLYPQMEAMARQCLQLARLRLGEESTAVASALGEIGDALFHQGKTDEAEKFDRQALAMKMKLFGSESREVSGALNNLALVLQKQRKLDEAETMQRQGLAMERKLLGKVNGKVAGSLANLANTLTDQGKLAEAEDLHRQSLAMTRKLLASVHQQDHPVLAQSLSELASLLTTEGNLAEAESLHREALEMRRKIFGNEHPDVLASLSKLAGVLQRQGKVAEAESIYREALALTRKRGDENVAVASALVWLAGTLEEQHKLAEAESLQRESLAMMRKGNDERLVADGLYNLALLLHEQGKLAESESTYREALAMRRRLLGNEDQKVAGTLEHLAFVLSDEMKLPEAETAEREALAINRKLHGDEHQYVASSLGDLAVILKAQARLPEAEAMQREALAMRIKVLGNEHLDVATSMHNLASVVKAQGRLTESEALNRDTLAMRRKLIGKDHIDIAKSLGNLGNVLQEQGKLAEAESMHREALAMRRRLFGDDDPELASSLNNFANVLSAQRKLPEAVSVLREALAVARKRSARDPSKEIPSLGVALHHLAGALRRQEVLAEARLLAKEAVEMYQRHPEWPLGEQQHASAVLADVLRDLGNLRELEALFREELAHARKMSASAPSGETSNLGRALYHLADVLRERQGLAEAQTLAEEAVAMYQRHPDWPSARRQHAVAILGEVLKDRRDFAALEALLRDELGRLRELSTNAPSGETPGMAAAQCQLAEALRERNALPAAQSLARQGAAMYRRHPDWPAEEREYAFAVLAGVATDLGDVSGAETAYRQELQSVRGRLAAGDPDLAVVIAQLTMTLLGEKKFAEAEPLARECLDICEKGIPEDWRTFNTRSLLGGALLGQKNYADAERMLLSGYEGMKQREEQISPADKLLLKEALQRLVQLYEATNQPARTAEWKQKLTDIENVK